MDTAVILLGGLGTRLAPLTDTIPKPALPFLDKPLITYMLEQFKDAGITRLVLALGHGADDILGLFDANDDFGFEMHSAHETEPLGTGGALRNCLSHIKGRGDILVANGDILSNVNLKTMLNAHRRARAELSIAVFAVPDPSRYGLIMVDDDLRVTDFREKSAGSGSPPFRINAGIYIIGEALIASIPAAKKVSLERETFPSLIKSGRRIFAYPHNGYWRDVGTLTSFWRAHFEVLHHYQLYDPAFGGYDEKGFQIFRNYIYISNTVKLDGKVNLEEQVVLSKGVKVGDGAAMSRSVIMPYAEIGAGAFISESIIGPDVVVKPGEVLDGLCVTLDRRVPFDTGDG